MVVLWPTFGRTEPPLTGLWPVLQSFTADLEPSTNRQVQARLAPIKLPYVPLGRAFDLRFAAAQAPSRQVTMLQVVEHEDGLLFSVPGQADVLVHTMEELLAFLGEFATSPAVAEIVRILDGRPSF